jgi:hypothetical protein
MENLLTSRNVTILGVLVLVGGTGTFFFQRHQEKREQESKTALYQIQKTFLEENKAIPEAERAPGVTLDVDAKYPKTVAELNGMLNAKTAPSRVLFEAALKVGNLYSEHNQFQKAIPAFKQAVGYAGSPFQKATGWYFLAVAQERGGEGKDALQSFQSGLSENVEGLKGELLLGLVRMSLKTGDTGKAKLFSERITKELQGSRTAELAEALLKEQP